MKHITSSRPTNYASKKQSTKKDGRNTKSKRMTAICEAQKDVRLSLSLIDLKTHEYQFGVTGMGKRNRGLRCQITGEVTVWDFSDRGE